MYVPVYSVCAEVLPRCSLTMTHSPFSLSPTGKVFVPKQKPIETRQEEVTTLDPELEEALSSATDTELCDLAGKCLNIPFRYKKKKNPSSLCWCSKTQAPLSPIGISDGLLRPELACCCYIALLHITFFFTELLG